MPGSSQALRYGPLYRVRLEWSPRHCSTGGTLVASNPIVGGLWCLGGGIAGVAAGDDRLSWGISSVVMGTGMALLYPNLVAAVGDISPPAWRSRALGTYRYWRDTGYAIGAVLLGWVAQWRQDAGIAFWATAGLLFLSGFWVAAFSEETHPHLNPAEESS